MIASRASAFGTSLVAQLTLVERTGVGVVDALVPTVSKDEPRRTVVAIGETASKNVDEQPFKTLFSP